MTKNCANTINSSYIIFVINLCLECSTCINPRLVFSKSPSENFIYFSVLDFDILLEFFLFHFINLWSILF